MTESDEKENTPGIELCRGFTPNPTSFFALMQRTKQERSRQNDSSPLCRKSGISDKRTQARLLKFHAFRHSQRHDSTFCQGKPTVRRLRKYVNPYPVRTDRHALLPACNAMPVGTSIAKTITEPLRF
jgi:hypothetical protein